MCLNGVMIGIVMGIILIRRQTIRWDLQKVLTVFCEEVVGIVERLAAACQIEQVTFLITKMATSVSVLLFLNKQKAAAKQILAQLRLFLFSNSQILDNQSFSRFLLTNSLKSLPFSKFFESKARS